MSWILVVRKSDGYVLEAPEITALQHFDALAEDVSVWCASKLDDRPVVVRRGDLIRLEDAIAMQGGAS